MGLQSLSGLRVWPTSAMWSGRQLAQFSVWFGTPKGEVIEGFGAV